MLSLKELLTYGYFPSRLPPPISAHTYGSALGQKAKLSQLRKLFSQYPPTKCSAHNQVRPGSLRRKLSIPNPISYWVLSDFVVENQKDLLGAASLSPISMTHPDVSSKSRFRAIERSHDFDELPIKRNHVRAQASCILQADVSRFYHSIYTHSIPWALHTKPVAKANRSSRERTLLGNDLDKLVRNLQDGQTLGIPIGPDVSFLIAELVLARVDLAVIQHRLGPAFRYIDDYEFALQDRAAAERVLTMLQEALNDYELALNPSKTAILALPLPTDSLAISELRCFSFRNTQQGQQWDLLRFFDRAFCLAQENADEAILTYAIRKLNGETINSLNWRIYENFLVHCSINEPGSLGAVLHQLVKYRAVGFPIQVDALGEALNGIIAKHAPLGHGSEVAWSLWLAIVFECPITADSAKVASQMDDPVVALLLLDSKARGLLIGAFNSARLASFMTGAELRNEMWLLAYEANIKEWLPFSGPDFVTRDPQFAYLKEQGISFYDYAPKKRVLAKAEEEAAEMDETYF